MTCIVTPHRGGLCLGPEHIGYLLSVFVTIRSRRRKIWATLFCKRRSPASSARMDGPPGYATGGRRRYPQAARGSKPFDSQAYQSATNYQVVVGTPDRSSRS